MESRDTNKGKGRAIDSEDNDNGSTTSNLLEDVQSNTSNISNTSHSYPTTRTSTDTANNAMAPPPFSYLPRMTDYAESSATQAHHTAQNLLPRGFPGPILTTRTTNTAQTPNMSVINQNLQRCIERNLQAIEKITYMQNQLVRERDRMRSELAGFPYFEKLPLEIQSMVWTYAVPGAREIHSKILVVLNHDLSDPKAIIPKPKDYKNLYTDIFARVRVTTTATSELRSDPYDFRWDGRKSMVLSLFHTCHESRLAVMKRFVLDIDYPDPKASRRLPWTEADSIFFPCPGFSFERRMALQWLSRNREEAPSCLATVQHVAVPLERALLQSFGVSRVIFGRTLEGSQWNNAWLKNMPRLKSLELYLDPGEVMENEEGKLKLYEPEDKQIMGCSRYTPSEVEKVIKDKLDELQGEYKTDIQPSVYVLCWQKPKATPVLKTKLNVLEHLDSAIRPRLQETDRILQLLREETPGTLHYRQLIVHLRETLVSRV